MWSGYVLLTGLVVAALHFTPSDSYLRRGSSRNPDASSPNEAQPQNAAYSGGYSWSMSGSRSAGGYGVSGERYMGSSVTDSARGYGNSFDRGGSPIAEAPFGPSFRGNRSRGGSGIPGGFNSAGRYAEAGTRSVGSYTGSGARAPGSYATGGSRGVGSYASSLFARDNRPESNNNQSGGWNWRRPVGNAEPSVQPALEHFSQRPADGWGRGWRRPQYSANPYASVQPTAGGYEPNFGMASGFPSGARNPGGYVAGSARNAGTYNSWYGGESGNNEIECHPPCQNGGICESENVCKCINPYHGSHCQYKKEQCSGRPPTPMNSRIVCSPRKCTATCRDGHEFPDGTVSLDITCKLGEWVMEGKTWNSIPDCGPTCTPKCQNGGNCIGFNMCECPQDYRGPLCQYSKDECNIKKLGFNGGYKCEGDSSVYICHINCPEGMHFKYAPSKDYTCRYDTGFFLPANPPPCVFDEGYEGSEVEMFYSNRSRTIHEDGSSRRVSITGPTAYATCYAWGGQHYKTLGDVILNFKSDCSYNLLSDDQDMFRLHTPVILPQCDIDKPGCHQVHFFLHDTFYKLSTDDFGYPVVLENSKFTYIPAKFPGIRFDIGSQSITATLSNLPIIFDWDLKDGVEIRVGERLWDHTHGLCGQKDKNPLASIGLKQYASNSRIDSINEICEEDIMDDTPCLSEGADMSAHQFCNLLIVDPRFAACRSVIDAQAFYDACKWEYCLCDNGGGTHCGCDTMALFVKEAIAKGVEISTWRDESCCPMECSGGKVYKSCGTELVCGGAGSPGGITSCTEGCFCPDGTFLSKDTCVPEEQCHCLLRGQRHPAGSKVPKECNTCTCAGGEWRCTTLDCPGRCEAVGDPHYSTFDRKSYDFMGKCSYYLLVMDSYTIEAENVPCDGAVSQTMGYSATVQRGMPSCTKSVTIKIGNTVIKLKQNKEVTVNGEDIILPAPLAHGYIRYATSEFIQVELEDGVEVWWDGKTSVFIHAPPTLKGKTKGLCGTFTGNQKDDFLTPEGDIEQDPISFANKWKTVESCDSQVSAIQEHPCDANPQNKPTAEKLCAHLTSNIFMHCHSFVDPSKYHTSCMYDMCSCQASVSDCLCPILSAYSMECAYQGVETIWRNKVRECGLACPRGQEYKVCAESCLRSCDDISREARCSSQCMEGCSCAQGSALDRKGNCIPISSCPCTYNGLQYPPSHAEIRRSALGFQLCTCENARWSCRLAESEEINKYPNDTAEAKACPASKHLVYTHCEPSTPITCQNMHSPGVHEVSESVCYGGCVCRKGYVLDSITNECVKPEVCPCHHGGQSYDEGSKIQEECNTCTCKQGKWDCTHDVCPGLCTAWGDSHFRTFDDRMYDFQGSCQYMLSKGVMSSDSESLTDSFAVIIEMVPCGSSGVSCSKSVTLVVGQQASQETVIFSEGKAVPSRGNHHRILLREAGLFIFADVPDLGLVVQWDKGTRVTVRLDSRWKDRVRGLCGNYNDNAEDDFQTPSGGITEASVDFFCDSWKVHEFCPVAQPIQDICELQPERKAWSITKCSVMKGPLFKKCHSEVPVGPYLEKCIYDTCACDEGGDCECLCTAIAAYAQECNTNGVPVAWRSQELCPLQCDQRCSEYSPCVPTCPVETCESTFDTKSELCQTDVCVEGCKLKPCLDDMVYSNLTNPECVPRASCKPPCMTVNGKVYYEGDLMEQDNCHSCYCSRKQKTCTGKPCSTTIIPDEVEILFTTTFNYGRTNIMKDEKFVCQHGWSEWFNRNHPIGKINSDHEPLPELSDITTATTGVLSSNVGCSKDQISRVECRVAETHEDIKYFGEDVECDASRGLICVNGCHDYEMRVFCNCGEDAAIPTTIRPDLGHLRSTNAPIIDSDEESARAILPHIQHCDPAHPLKPHEHLCAVYYRCEETTAGPNWVLTNCSVATYFNPHSMMCEWPQIVKDLRPDCTDLSQVETAPTTRPVVDSEGGCLYDEEWDDCSINCAQLCHYYEEILFETKTCEQGRRCAPGCRAKKRPHCPVGMRWRDAETCVDETDCICISKSGKMVKPGEIVQESNCEVCQCLHNQYKCDDTACQPISHIPVTTPQPVILFTPFQGTIEPPFVKTDRPVEFVQFISSPPTVIELIASTVTPPPHCNEINYVPLADNLPPEAFSASSFDLDAEPPRASYSIPGIWRPAKERNRNPNEYLQIDLGKVNNIYGVVIKGLPQVNEYITKYHVLYSTDNHNYKYITFMDIPELFSGPMNRFEESKQVFSNPVEARFIRISPKAWNREIAAKVDIIGCLKSDIFSEIIAATTPPPPQPTTEPKCLDQMSNGMIDDQITASTGRPSANQVSIDGGFGWVPDSFAVGEWLQFDFLDKRELTGIVLMGGGYGVSHIDNFPSWVQEFQVKFSPDGLTWNSIKNQAGQPMIFHGNDDSIKKVRVIFDQPIRARYLKIIPQKWHKKISMRVEVLGCYEPYPEVRTFVTTVGPPPRGLEECQLCPGASYPDSANCPCLPGQWWDGERCSPRQQCPCYIGYFKYAVGSAYESELCEQCICALNGVPQCNPKRCPPCKPGTVSLITNGCGCLCKPCGPDEILCPNANVCIDRSAWCDGTVDCGDDELNCAQPQPSTNFVRRITTPAPIEEKAITCPPIECPPGFTASLTELTNEVVVEEKPKGWSPFGSNSRWRSLYGRMPDRTSSSSGYKTAKTRKGSYDFKKHAYAQPKTIEPKGGEPVKLSHQCPQYKCIPIKGSPIIDECPPKPRCQPGYELQAAKSPEEKCNIYSCVLKEVKPPDGKCNVTGRTFTTFDGTEYKYDICDHVLARDKINNLWEIRVMKECTYVGPCYKYLVIKQDDNVLKFTPNLSVEFNGYNYTIPQIQKIGGQTEEFALKQVSDTYLLFSSAYEFSLVWDTLGNVKIIVPGTSVGKVDGMCGFYDGHPENDKMKPDSSLAETSAEFGDSWGTPEKCQTHVCPIEIQKEAFKACSAIREEPLNECGSWVPLEKLVSHCVETLCSCIESGLELQECRCNVLLQAVTDCRSFAPTIELNDWRLANDCPVECPDGLVYHECFRRACEPCCSELMVEDACPVTDQCFPGCYCPAGFVRDGDRCVKPSDCRDCMCEGYDKSRFVPFDKQDYRFLGNCTYVLSQTLTDAKGPSFKIYGTNGLCEDGSGEICLHSVTILVKDHIVHVSYQHDKLRLKVDGVEQIELARKSDWLNVHELAGKSILVCLVKMEIDLEFFIKGKGFSLKVPSHYYYDKTEGLCGNCNLNSTDDFKSSDGLILVNDVDQFGSSWKVQESPEFFTSLGIEEEMCGVGEKEPECILPPPNDDPCLKLMDATVFGRCHAVVDPKSHVDNCHLSLCKEEISICQFMENYVRDCTEEGICVDWRTPERCPYFCPRGLEYKYCTLGCKLNCDNYKVFQEDLSACKSPLKEGCVCPDGQVTKDGACINATRCEPCDSEGHFPGDEWEPDPCTKCICESPKPGLTQIGPQVQCQTTHCPPTTLCTKGFRSTLIKASENECCPKYVCVPEPTSGPKCEEPQQPVCGFGQVMQLETTASGCQEFTCRCKALEECDSTDAEMSEKREPGMVAELDDSGCCPRVVVSCKKDTCPPPPQCPPHHEPNPKETGSCCHEYTCEIPEGKCLYEMLYEEEPKGGERERSPADRNTVLKDFGDTWSDGPCRTCECKEGNTKASCNKKVCGLPPKSDSYVYEPTYQKHQCCPIYMRTACKVNGIIHKIGETWPDPEGDPCKHYTCVSGRAGEVSIKEATQTCNTQCKIGWEYQKSSPSECCGLCVQIGCVIDGRVFSEGANWTSADMCTEFACELFDEQFQIVSQPVVCENITGCPDDQVYKEGCCHKCHVPVFPYTRDLKNCVAESLAKNETVQLIRETTEEHGACYNLEPIIGFAECKGTCDSYTKFNQDTGEQDSLCNCCEGTQFSPLSIRMDCADGFFFNKIIKVPTDCNCNLRNCDVNSPQFVKKPQSSYGR